MLFNQEKQSSSPEHAEVVTQRISEIELSIQFIRSLKPAALNRQSESVSESTDQDYSGNRLSELKKAYQEVEDAFAA